MSSTAWMKVVVFLCLLSGCALPATAPREAPITKAPAPAPPPVEAPVAVTPPPAKDPFAAFPRIFRTKALSEEQQGHLRIALLHWRVVQAFLPEDPEAAERVTALERDVRTRADGHLKKGKERYREGKYEEARREFLAALAYDPFLDEASDYLKHQLVRPDSRAYVTKEGDTPKSVAQDVYKDTGKDYLVAYFSGLEPGAPLPPGTRLTLPLFDTPLAGANQAPSRAQKPASVPGAARTPSARPTSPDDSLDKARASFRAGDYRKAAEFAEQALQQSPASREAKDVLNAAYYELGADYFRKREYPDSLRMFRKVEASYKDKKDMVARVESSLRKEVEKHYAAGLQCFLAEDLEGAVREWEATLKLDPAHLKTKRDIERARGMLEQVKGAQ
jgi:tetratricopeptide (TPR) repeat protein